VLIEFFQGGDRHIDIVFFEAEQAGGVVHQHVGVQHEQLGFGDGFSRHGGLGRRGEVENAFILPQAAGRLSSEKK